MRAEASALMGRALKPRGHLRRPEGQRATREARNGREAKGTGLESGHLGVNVSSAPAGQSQPLIDDTEKVLPESH